MSSKLNFVVFIDRFDYLSGMNHCFHSIAEQLARQGENVYTLGPGKPGFKYKFFKIENFDNNTGIIPEINHIDLKYNNLDPSSTVFITNFYGEYPYLEEYNRIVLITDPDGHLELNKNYLYFYQSDSYRYKDKKYTGPLRFYDPYTKFWYPSSFNTNKNTFLLKKLFRTPGVDIDKHVNENLRKFQKITRYNFENIDNIAGILGYYPNAFDEHRKLQRQMWSESEYFICFDKHSANAVFAALCGANSVIIPLNNELSPEEFREKNPVYKYGVAYGIEDLDHMKKTKNLVRKHCQEMHDVYLNDVKNFIKICYEKF